MKQSQRDTHNDPFESKASGWDPKIVGIISYLTIAGWIIAFFMNKPKTEYASFHLRQSIGILVFAAATSMLGVIPILGWMTALAGWFFSVFLWLIAFLGAIQGEEKAVPFIGEYIQDFFKSI